MRTLEIAIYRRQKHTPWGATISKRKMLEEREEYQRKLG